MNDDSIILESVLHGIALGDALGLPYEGLKPARIARRLGAGPLKPVLLPGVMMVSDDTDHACMALGAWRDCDGNPDTFSKILASRFRWWFAVLPPGIGLATAKSAIRLWMGFGPARSGIYSAGNGPLMRAGVLGVAIRHDTPLRREIVLRSTRLTHTDERAIDSARILSEACALLAHFGRPTDMVSFCRQLAAIAETKELRSALEKLADPPATGIPLADYLHGHVLEKKPDSARYGVSGYTPESLAGALAAFLYGGPDGLSVIRTAIGFGGDTDSVASFAGALAGAADIEAFKSSASQKLLSGLADIPWNSATLTDLAHHRRPAAWRIALRPVRNLIQLIIVIGHGLLRITGW